MRKVEMLTVTLYLILSALVWVWYAIMESLLLKCLLYSPAMEENKMSWDLLLECYERRNKNRWASIFPFCLSLDTFQKFGNFPKYLKHIFFAILEWWLSGYSMCCCCIEPKFGSQLPYQLIITCSSSSKGPKALFRPRRVLALTHT